MFCGKQDAKRRGSGSGERGILVGVIELKLGDELVWQLIDPIKQSTNATLAMEV